MTQIWMNQVRPVAEQSMSLLDLPELLSLLYRCTFLSVVGHFVEDRHRMIPLQSSGSSMHTLLGGHSSLMRKDESNSLCQNPDFLIWVLGVGEVENEGDVEPALVRDLPSGRARRPLVCQAAVPNRVVSALALCDWVVQAESFGVCP